VLGWHQHDTVGAFSSLAVIQEDSTALLTRGLATHNHGRTGRYIERKRFRRLRPGGFVLATRGQTTNGRVVSTITTGMWHGSGQKVRILAEVRWQPQQTVTKRAINCRTREQGCAVGFPILPTMQTHPFAQQSAQDGGLRTRRSKNVNAVNCASTSLGVYGRPSLTSLRPVSSSERREIWGAAGLVSGVINRHRIRLGR